jgi:autotransporter-associated beta strand protein
LTLLPAGAATWSGPGPDGKWLDGENWIGGVAPTAGSTLIFTGTGNLNATNNFTLGTVFDGIEFVSPAGPFVLGGNLLTLDGVISDNQALVPETINLNMTLGQSVSITVGTGALLSLNGNIAGADTGLTLAGGGQLTLNGSNTFTGTINLDSGIAVISADSNLGLAPASATPGDIVILSGGNLHTTNNLILNPNRGIVLGNTSGDQYGHDSSGYRDNDLPRRDG